MAVIFPELLILMLIRFVVLLAIAAGCTSNELSTIVVAAAIGAVCVVVATLFTLSQLIK